MKRRNREIRRSLFNILIAFLLIVVSYPLFTSNDVLYAKEVAKYYDGYVALNDSNFKNDLNVVSNVDGNEYTLFVTNNNKNTYKYELLIASSDKNIQIETNLNVKREDDKLISLGSFEIKPYQTKQAKLNVDSNSNFTFKIKETD